MEFWGCFKFTDGVELLAEELTWLLVCHGKLNTDVLKVPLRTVFCVGAQNAVTLQHIQWLKMPVVSKVKQVEKFA